MKGKKSHVNVFVRTRPTGRPYEGLKTESKDGQVITVAFPKQYDCLINNQLESLAFKFDGVLENVGQDVVYSACVHDAVEGVLEGYNATVFAYGQTGAGKTFTMSGDPRNYAHRGIIPRAIQHVFREVDLRSDRIYSVAVSYMEIYNESLRDLLADDPVAAADTLAIVDDASSTVVRGLSKVAVSSEEEALHQFFLGDQTRSTSLHALNASSSRSHALFTLHVEMRASAEADERALLSKLHLVDLAGSERIKKSQAAAGGGDTNYEQLRESSCINKSLTFLEQVVNALARGDAHVPFRQSKLTAALRGALGGNSNTVMIANVWPEEAYLEESVSTLRFASRVRCLQTEPTVNESADPLLALKKAERQVKELRQELAMRDMLSGRGRVAYDDLSEGERLDLQQLVLRYLTGSADLDELPTDSLKRIRETYKAFKAVSSSWAAAAANAGTHRSSQVSAGGQGGSLEPEAAGVGEVQAALSTGFCIGTAPLNARPPPASPRGHAPGAGAAAGATPGSSDASFSSNAAKGAQATRNSTPQPPQQQWTGPLQQQVAGPATAALTVSQGSASAVAAAGGAAADPLLDVDRNALFSKYKHSVSQGVRQAELVKQQQQLLTQLKQNVKDGGIEVNAAKSDIDSLTEQLEAKRQMAAAGSSGDADVVDDERYQLLQELKEAKARYRELYEGLKELRSSCDAASAGLAAAKEALLSGFEGWLNQQQPGPRGSTAAPGSMSTQPSGQQISALRPGALEAAASRGDYDDVEDLDASEAFDRADLVRKAAATGDPGSTAFYAAKKHTSKVLAVRQGKGLL